MKILPLQSNYSEAGQDLQRQREIVKQHRKATKKRKENSTSAVKLQRSATRSAAERDLADKSQNFIPVEIPIEKKFRLSEADLETPKMPYCNDGWT